MKNLGVIAVLLVFTNFTFAETETKQPQEKSLTLAMTDIVPMPALIEFQPKRFVLDQDSTLADVNAKLEQKLEQKLNALVATQLQSLD
jgi:hypothetical protein